MLRKRVCNRIYVYIYIKIDGYRYVFSRSIYLFIYIYKIARYDTDFVYLECFVDAFDAGDINGDVKPLHPDKSENIDTHTYTYG